MCLKPIIYYNEKKENYEFKGKSISAQINPARKIVGLLNFINEQLILGNPDYKY